MMAGLTDRRAPSFFKLALATVAGALAALLTGCGGGGGTEQAPDFTPASVSAPMSVLVLGDSTMTPYWPGEASVPEMVRAATGWRVDNRAVSGSTSCQADMDAIRTARADVVTANYGLNDAYGLAGAPRHDMGAYTDCLERIAAAARDAGSVLVLVAANPVLASPGWDATRIDGYNAAKRGIGGAFYCALPSIAWSLETLPDGQHPNRRAKPDIAAALLGCVGRAALSLAR